MNADAVCRNIIHARGCIVFGTMEEFRTFRRRHAYQGQNMEEYYPFLIDTDRHGQDRSPLRTRTSPAGSRAQPVELADWGLLRPPRGSEQRLRHRPRRRPLHSFSLATTHLFSPALFHDSAGNVQPTRTGRWPTSQLGGGTRPTEPVRSDGLADDRGQSVRLGLG